MKLNKWQAVRRETAKSKQTQRGHKIIIGKEETFSWDPCIYGEGHWRRESDKIQLSLQSSHLDDCSFS